MDGSPTPARMAWRSSITRASGPGAERGSVLRLRRPIAEAAIRRTTSPRILNAAPRNDVECVFGGSISDIENDGGGVRPAGNPAGLETSGLAFGPEQRFVQRPKNERTPK
ncbi:hypothetical protein ACFQY7_06480 [Actinomadura luteofluorescens]|uniref:hypothetical protein n=1 Tax=Actinomadura luteofluorescens TaxID=46163 RepID=UPI0036363831